MKFNIHAKGYHLGQGNGWVPDFDYGTIEAENFEEACDKILDGDIVIIDRDAKNKEQYPNSVEGLRRLGMGGIEIYDNMDRMLYHKE